LEDRKARFVDRFSGTFGFVALSSREGDHVFNLGVLELTVKAVLAAGPEACLSEVEEETSDLSG
jgi:hypothetical protein